MSAAYAHGGDWPYRQVTMPVHGHASAQSGYIDPTDPRSSLGPLIQHHASAYSGYASPPQPLRSLSPPANRFPGGRLPGSPPAVAIGSPPRPAATAVDLGPHRVPSHLPQPGSWAPHGSSQPVAPASFLPAAPGAAHSYTPSSTLFVPVHQTPGMVHLGLGPPAQSRPPATLGYRYNQPGGPGAVYDARGMPGSNDGITIAGYMNPCYPGAGAGTASPGVAAPPLHARPGVRCTMSPGRPSDMRLQSSPCGPSGIVFRGAANNVQVRVATTTCDHSRAQSTPSSPPRQRAMAGLQPGFGQQADRVARLSSAQFAMAVQAAQAAHACASPIFNTPRAPPPIVIAASSSFHSPPPPSFASSFTAGPAPHSLSPPRKTPSWHQVAQPPAVISQAPQPQRWSLPVLPVVHSPQPQTRVAHSPSAQVPLTVPQRLSTAFGAAELPPVIRHVVEPMASNVHPPARTASDAAAAAAVAAAAQAVAMVDLSGVSNGLHEPLESSTSGEVATIMEAATVCEASDDTVGPPVQRVVPLLNLSSAKLAAAYGKENQKFMDMENGAWQRLHSNDMVHGNATQKFMPAVEAWNEMEKLKKVPGDEDTSQSSASSGARPIGDTPEPGPEPMLHTHGTLPSCSGPLGSDVLMTPQQDVQRETSQEKRSPRFNFGPDLQLDIPIERNYQPRISWGKGTSPLTPLSRHSLSRHSCMSYTYTVSSGGLTPIDGAVGGRLFMGSLPTSPDSLIEIAEEISPGMSRIMSARSPSIGEPPRTWVNSTSPVTRISTTSFTPKGVEWKHRYKNEFGHFPRTAEQLCAYALNRGGRVTWSEARVAL